MTKFSSNWPVKSTLTADQSLVKRTLRVGILSIFVWCNRKTFPPTDLVANEQVELDVCCKCHTFVERYQLCSVCIDVKPYCYKYNRNMSTVCSSYDYTASGEE